MNLLRYPELDLPIYPEDEVAYTTHEISEAARSGGDTILRRACLRYEGPERNLKTLLDLGDRVLTNVCTTMNIDQAGHTWGLAPLSDANRNRLRAHVDPETYDNSITSYKNNLGDPLIPKGYGLVALASVIQRAQPLDYFQRERAVEGWNPSGIFVEENGYRVYNEDLRRAEQFVSDPQRVQQGESGIVLIDPEPRLRLIALDS
jgi:hypothetical protein